MEPKTFKDARLTLGVTQGALARYLGLSMRQIRRYENGESEIPGPLAILIDILINKKIPKTSLINKKI